MALLLVHVGVMRGDIQRVKTLLEDSIKNDRINLLDGDYSTLKLAVQSGNARMVRLLLKRGASVHHIYSSGTTALGLAVTVGNIDVCRALISYGANVNVGNSTPLQDAIAWRKDNITMLLLRKGARVNKRDSNGWSPLFYALNKIFVIPPALLTPEVSASNLKLVRMLLDYGADPNIRDIFGRNALHHAIFAHKWEPTVQYPPLFNFMAQVTKLLLEKGADVHAVTNDGTTALHAAATTGCDGAFKVLLEFGANVYATNAQGYTALEMCILRRNTLAVKLLLKRGHGIYSKDRFDQFMFHMAARHGFEEIVEMFLDFGANVNSKDDRRRTALHYAAEEGRRHTVELLLYNGADCNCKSLLNETPLHLAAYAGHGMNVALLLAYGADINALTLRNETPLSKALRGAFIARLNRTPGADARPNDVVVNFLKGYIVMRMTANMLTRAQDRVAVENFDPEDKLRTKCKAEMEKLVTEGVGKVSYHDILTSNLSQLARYGNNEALCDVMDTGEFMNEFPIYGTMLRCQFLTGKVRAQLMKLAGNVSRFLPDDFPSLPLVCIDMIMSFVSNDELKILIEAWKPELALTLQYTSIGQLKDKGGWMLPN